MTTEAVELQRRQTDNSDERFSEGRVLVVSVSSSSVNLGGRPGSRSMKSSVNMYLVTGTMSSSVAPRGGGG